GGVCTGRYGGRSVRALAVDAEYRVAQAAVVVDLHLRNRAVGARDRHDAVLDLVAAGVRDTDQTDIDFVVVAERQRVEERVAARHVGAFDARPAAGREGSHRDRGRNRAVDRSLDDIHALLRSLTDSTFGDSVVTVPLAF